MKTYIVGDIHGCYFTFLDLLNKVEFVNGDKLFCTGDLVDRGKFSRNVLSFFKFSETYRSVRGNHDDKFLRWLKGNNIILSEKDGNYGNHHSIKDELTLKNMYIVYLDSLPLVLHPTLDSTIVHAGFYPWQNHHIFEEIFDKKKKVVMYIRHIHGDQVAQGLENSINKDVDSFNNKKVFWDESLPMWYDKYKYKEYGGTVFFGHQPMKEPLIIEGKTRIIGLDTGACFGNKLTCYSLTEDQFYSVPTNSIDIDEKNIREL